MSCDTDQLRVSDASVSLCVCMCFCVLLCAAVVLLDVVGIDLLINQSMEIVKLRFFHVKTNHFVTMTLE